MERASLVICRCVDVTPPAVVERSTVMSVFGLCVCEFVREHISGITCRIFTSLQACYFVARSSSGGVAICYARCTFGVMDDINHAI